MPETKPDLSIDEEGICDACRSAEIKEEIDWDARREELVEILERYKSKDGSNYDCIIPVSGGKDSTFQVMTILELGYRPLLVTWSACSYTDIGQQNIANMQKLGADHIQFTPNPQGLPGDVLGGLPARGRRLLAVPRGHLQLPGAGGGQLQRAAARIWREPAARVRRPRGGRARQHDRPGSGSRSSAACSATASTTCSASRASPRATSSPIATRSDEELERVGVTGIFLGYYLKWDAREQLQKVLATGSRSTSTRPTPATRPIRKGPSRTTRTWTGSSWVSTTT